MNVLSSYALVMYEAQIEVYVHAMDTENKKE